jgi:hypothetical protein
MNIQNIPNKAAVVGRVKSWLKNPTKKLPASCTVFSVEDSMEGKDGIEESWIFVSHGLRNAAGVAIDLSKIRPINIQNSDGLVSSGAVSFAKMYSELNQLLRRGGTFKNGAVTLFLDHDHPDCQDFLNASPDFLPWAKKAIYVDETVKNNPLLPLIAQKVNEGSVWLAKKQYDKKGNRIYSNVCLEVLLPSRGTCLLSHVNLGECSDLTELPLVFMANMQWLCDLHANTGIGDKQYLSPSEDKQVGLGVIGLANLLAIHKTTYSQFVVDLEAINAGFTEDTTSVAYWLNKAYQSAAEVATANGMERAFVVAPTANCHRRYTDSDGFTSSAEISPPLNYFVDRDSELFGVETYEFHPKTEIAKNVGWDTQWRLLNAYQTMMDKTGLGHSISANLWNDIKITDKWIVEEFMPSALKTTYYRLTVNQDALDKSQVMLACSAADSYCEACGG